MPDGALVCNAIGRGFKRAVGELFGCVDSCVSRCGRIVVGFGRLGAEVLLSLFRRELENWNLLAIGPLDVASGLETVELIGGWRFVWHTARLIGLKAKDECEYEVDNPAETQDAPKSWVRHRLNGSLAAAR